eukprot:8303573-Pyramimonas_sp.AAC.1
MSSTLAMGSEKVTQLLMATHVKQTKADSPGYTRLWNAMLSDFEGLFKPDVASRGPWRFILLFALGDEGVRSVELGLTNVCATTECCSECKVRSG